VGRPSLFATTRQFLDDLGLGSLDQLPLLSQVDTQISALAGMIDEAPVQASLSLDEAIADLPDESHSTPALEPQSEMATPASEFPPEHPPEVGLSHPLNGEDHA